MNTYKKYSTPVRFFHCHSVCRSSCPALPYCRVCKSAMPPTVMYLCTVCDSATITRRRTCYARLLEAAQRGRGQSEKTPNIRPDIRKRFTVVRTLQSGWVRPAPRPGGRVLGSNRAIFFFNY